MSRSSDVTARATRPAARPAAVGDALDLDPDRCELACVHPEQVRPLLGRLLSSEAAEQVAATFAMLADPTRARILHALSLATELCVCDLALLVGVSQSAASHQLRLLRTHRVVTRRRAGRIAYYRLADEHVRHVLADGLRHALEHPASDGGVLAG
jgi:ArsR family transcriptional regulator, lead/cadmium/zinc/bismuth-responsive transcriptional repressor